MPEDPNAELSRQSYWDKRYDTSATDSANSKDDGEDGSGNRAESYDWLRNFSTVRPFLSKYLPPADTEPRILHCGNGNSTLPPSLQTHLSYKHQTAIDFSPVVTASMKAKYPAITWLEMDIRALQFPDSSFDVAIDKATLDAMFYGSLWDPEDEVRENVRRYVDELARVLKPGGIWLYITWRQPHFIRPLISRPDVWDISVETLADEPGGGGMFEYFGWVVRKHVA